MARTARKEPDDTGEVKTKDFAKAKSLYLNDIKPAGSRQGDAMKDASDGYKTIKGSCNIQSTSARAAFRLVEMEAAKRDDWLRGFVGLLKEFGIEIDPKDMVDQMQSGDGYARPKPQLVTIGTPSDGTETDLADAAEFMEMTAEELAQQEGRKPEEG